jgi:tetratricopeptide (TPR) repeat protein
MKKLLILTMALVFASGGFLTTRAAYAYNFGDYRSETMVSKAWGALGQGDIEAVLAYTNKTIELYAAEAKKMQEGLTGYVIGENKDVFALWALNDVATALYIQGEAYRKANMIEEAKAAYSQLVKDYTYGQTWDTKGWFWKPAEAAKEKLSMFDTGVEFDFGDYSSSFLVGQAWKALAKGDVQSVAAYADKTLELYAGQAQKMQESLTEYPWESKEKVFEYWALNDVGTALFIKGEALKKAGDPQAAKIVYQKLVDNYFYAQCWDPQGWFWKPAEAAQQSIDEIGE